MSEKNEIPDAISDCHSPFEVLIYLQSIKACVFILLFKTATFEYLHLYLYQRLPSSQQTFLLSCFFLTFQSF